MFAASKTDGITAAPSGNDPYWSNVSLLTNFENNLSFQDASTSNFAITRTGTVNPSLNTPFSGVGGSVYFTGATSTQIALTTTVNAIGTSAFTLEMWYYYSASTGNDQIIFDSGVNGLTIFYEVSTDKLRVFDRITAQYIFATGAAFTKNAWVHIAFVRSGTGSNQTAIYINGVQSATATMASNFTSTSVVIGARYTPSASLWYGMLGFLSNTRIVNGTAVYTAAFTPPTAPLTAISGTSLLITGTGQGMFDNSTFVDQGPNALTVTATGAPVYSGLSPFGNTYPGSVYINNGATNRLTTPVNTAFDFGTGDFTIETWVNFTSIPAVGAIVTNYLNSTTGWTLEALSTGWIFYNGDTSLVSYTSTPVINTWYHIAVARSGTSLKMFLNGTQVASVTNSTNITGSTNGVAIGALLGTLYGIFGYVSNLRIVKGTAVYTSNFTPSTTPLTAITNTSLLVRGDTGAFYDLSNKGNAMSNTGTTAVTTQVKKYGAESASYTATAYQTVTDAANLQLGAGDYTIEAWVYRNAAGVLHSLICKGAAATGWLLQVNTSNQLVFTVTSTAILTSTTTIGAAAWTHVTVTRSGTSTRLFVGGNLEATATDSTNFNQTNALLAGADRSNANGLNGYLDDIRITKGVARYTANFTPPTATFPTN